MTLDHRFFERVAAKDHKGFVLESYKAVYARSTMVLFSRKTRTPLAALTLKADDVGCLSMLTGRPAPKNAPEPYLQGMLNMPDQAFSFTISNLSNEGMINFNVLHTPHRVSEVDPGPTYGINEVNELHKNQSYTIEADQRNNRRMILTGKTKIVKDPVTLEEKRVVETVKDSEAEEKPTGLYFYLSVVADKACQSMVDKFAEGTVWKVTPGFVRQVAKPPEPARHFAYEQQMVGGRSSAFGASSGPDAFYSGLSFACASRRAMPSGSMSNNGYSSAFGQAPQQQRGTAAAPPRASMEESEEEDAFLAADDNAGPLYDEFPARFASSAPAGFAAHSMAAAAPPPASNQHQYMEDMDDEEELGAALSPASVMRETDGSVGDSNRAKEMKKRKVAMAQSGVAPVDVGSTQAADLSYGSEVMVQSSYTGHDYAYEHCSEPTVLCMSIWEEMKFLKLVDVEEELAAEVQEWVENEGKRLIESLNAIYKSDKCVIDLESEADTIICTCGHQCINHVNVGTNLRTCPMCRSPITAFVRADGIITETKD